jgi:hypothetical protein
MNTAEEADDIEKKEVKKTLNIVFTLERGISTKNNFVRSETVHHKEVFTSRGFTVYCFEYLMSPILCFDMFFSQCTYIT